MRSESGKARSFAAELKPYLKGKEWAAASANTKGLEQKFSKYVIGYICRICYLAGEEFPAFLFVS